MSMTQGLSRSAVPRRVEAPGFIHRGIASTGTSPGYSEIVDAMNPRVGQTRARQNVERLVDLGAIGRDLASRRGIKIIDHTLCRQRFAESVDTISDKDQVKALALSSASRATPSLTAAAESTFSRSASTAASIISSSRSEILKCGEYRAST